MKLRKVKLLVSLIIVLVTVFAVCNVNSLATTPTVTVKSGNSNANSVLTNDAAENTKATDEQGATKNSANNVANTKKASNNTNTNKNETNTNKNESNTSTNSTKKSKLPYAGTNGTVVFIVVALAASAIYAYKKVSDYNI